MNPNNALIDAATSDVPNVSLYEATTRGFHAAAQKPSQPSARALDHQRRQRNQHDQAQVQHRVAHRQPEAGQDTSILFVLT